MGKTRLDVKENESRQDDGELPIGSTADKPSQKKTSNTETMSTTSPKLSKSSEKKKETRESVNKTPSTSKEKSCKVSKLKIKKTGKRGRPLKRNSVLKKCISNPQLNATATPDLSVLQRTRNALYDFQIKGVKTLHAAAKKHRVSYSILLRRYHGKVSINRVGTGRLPFLTAEQEDKIVKWLLEMGKKGQPLSGAEILKQVRQYMEQTGEKKKFKEFRPTTGWLTKFLGRHPELKDATDKYLAQKHAKSNAASRSLSEYLATVLRLDLFNRPSQIYTVTKSTFHYKASQNLVVSTKATQNQSRAQNKLTAVLCANASGTMVAPFLVFKGDRFSPASNQMTGMPKDWGSDLSLNGCVNQTAFNTWLESHFIPQVLPQRPLLLLLDTIDTHVDKSTSKLAKDNGIEFICPMSSNNFSHLQQPLQYGFIDTLKQCWNQRLQEKASAVNEQNVVGVFFKAWYDAYKPGLIHEGFCTGGLYPTQPWSSSPVNTSVRPATVQQHDASDGTAVETADNRKRKQRKRKKQESSNIDDDVQANKGELTDGRVSTAETSGKRDPKKQRRKRRHPRKVDQEVQCVNEEEDEERERCKFCHEGEEDGDGTWVCCDSCDHWMHLQCLPEGFVTTDDLEGEAVFHCTTCKDAQS